MLDDRSQTAAISTPKSRLSAQRRAAETRASWSWQQVSSESVCISLCTRQQDNTDNNKTAMGVKEVTLTVAVLNLTLQLQNKWLTNNRRQYSAVCQLLTQQQRKHTLNKASYSSDTIPLNITKCRSFPWVRSGQVKRGPAPTPTKCNEMSSAALFLCGHALQPLPGFKVRLLPQRLLLPLTSEKVSWHVTWDQVLSCARSCFLIGPQSAAVK